MSKSGLLRDISKTLQLKNTYIFEYTTLQCICIKYKHEHEQ
jgi:hypothetical protein